jgi:AraC-like DNA-binding protein
MNRLRLSDRRSARSAASERGRDLFLSFEERLSDSPFVERVWRSWSGAGGRFVSVATTNLELVVSKVRGRMVATHRGPEMRPTIADCPGDGAWVAIRFRPGVHLRPLPTAQLLDGRSLHAPVGADRRFSLLGADWEPPSFENAEAFVARLARAGVLARDEAVEAAMAADGQILTPRSVQRRFLKATGMTFAHLRQVRRARQAAVMLQEGASILDTAFECGYFDQAHLTRSVKTYIGQTPAMIARAEQQLSFLYKTGDGRSL